MDDDLAGLLTEWRKTRLAKITNWIDRKLNGAPDMPAKPMTPDNPDPLEVWLAARTCHWAGVVASMNDSSIEPDQAAAAIIAQHYAPVIARNEALRAEVARLTRSLQQNTDALAQVGAKP